MIIKARKSVRNKVLQGLSAAALGPFVSIFVQVVMVPLFLKAWGPQRYGEWLLLSAIPSYLSMSDVGFGTAAGNEMTMQVAAGNHGAALRTFQSTVAFVLAMCLSVMAVATMSVKVAPIHRLLHLQTVSPQQVKTTLLLLSAYALVSLFGGVLATGFRCDGNFARGAVVQTGVRLVENVICICTVFLGAGPALAALGLLTARLGGTILQGCLLRTCSPWLKFGLTYASASCVRTLFIPAISFMAFPLGYALSLQGMVLVVGYVLDPLSATIFSTIRILTRFGLQFTDVVKSSVWPELSVALGKANLKLARRLYRAACQVSFWFSIVGAMLLYLVGRTIFGLWTHGRVPFESRAFLLLLISGVAASLWSTSSVVALASNAHARLAMFFLFITAASVCMAFVLTRYQGLIGTSIAVLAIDIGMCWQAIKASDATLQESAMGFIKSLFDVNQMGTLAWQGLRSKFGNRATVDETS